ncbi:hypothetical protein NG2371_00958 [Nocardia gamkensis]|nr:hypothetical protein [Nocardia gamkensis]
MFDDTPPERRIAAVVRAVTGRLRMTSSTPFHCARYAAKPASSRPAGDESCRATAASSWTFCSSDSAALAIPLIAAGGAERPVRLVPSSSPATRWAQYSLSEAKRVLSR